IVNEYSRLELPLLGVHQVVNAAVAVGLVEGLSFSWITIPVEAVQNGLAKVQWPGRREVIRDNPKVVLDGAQNKASVRVLVQAVQENFDYNKLILIFGISKDKDIEGVLRTITPLVDEIILTRADNPRSAGPEDLKKILKNKLKFSKMITVAEQMPRAYETALEKARDNDLVLVTGSFFVMGEIPGYKVE
ncbi:MAG: bifunctional folylpolyglutamate synthase/dihydrofolate synthase, partial [Candidatus Omnitrophica bacterium]|nr:bifunctional folylpolyglutamate synthase/dihydrofolate synthase [Candidatus Omnitrophota bacterium]